MAKEIERKYLVTNDSYKAKAINAINIKQGYISRKKEGTVRVRIKGDKAFLTIKGANKGIVRNEWEYEIPVMQAEEMLSSVCEGNIIDKTRYIIPYNGFTWEVDEFHGRLAPLVIAEVELPSADSKPSQPDFIGSDVSSDPKYYNSNL
jgi:adenylate cyclase